MRALAASEPCFYLTGNSCHGVLYLALPRGSGSNLWTEACGRTSPWKAVQCPRLAIVQDEESIMSGGEKSAAKQARAGNDTHYMPSLQTLASAC